jgi:hypothetical protein
MFRQTREPSRRSQRSWAFRQSRFVSIKRPKAMDITSEVVDAVTVAMANTPPEPGVSAVPPNDYLIDKHVRASRGLHPIECS